MNSVQPVLSDFLSRYCPEPGRIQDAIARHNLWGVNDYAPGKYVCREGEPAEACWIILSGHAEILQDGEHIAFRYAGQMLGEQAFVATLMGRSGRRTADVIARGPLKLVCFDASIQEKFSAEERAAWSLTLAAVINDKLVEATQQRAQLRKVIDNREELLSRFAEGDALGLVKKALEDNPETVTNRDVIVWFSDIANFSTWATDKEPNEVARVSRLLVGAQIERIRAAGGYIDKLMGDGVMAIWFVDTADRRTKVPDMALRCARKVQADINDLLRAEGLDHVLGIRIGMHTGNACFGDFGARQRIAVTVLGHHVNLASRYEQAKDPGLDAVRVSPAIKALVESSPRAGDWAFSNPVTVTVKHGVTIEIYSPHAKGKDQ